MSKYKLKGYTELYGFQIPIIEMDSKSNKRFMLLSSFSKICGVNIGVANALINNDISIDKGKSIIDIIDNKEFTDVLLENNIINKDSLHKSKSIYILSNYGCKKLLRAIKHKTNNAAHLYRCLNNSSIKDGYFRC